MICPACATPNDAARKFCSECGARLLSACAECGSANMPGAKFCGECGSALVTGSTGLAQPRIPGAVNADAQRVSEPGRIAERKYVSVLFADLVGFTSLSEARDPEEVREFLTRYFETCRSLVGRYGGTIEKFIGDAVMAVWGVPAANEDDAERAVRAALDLTAAVVALGEDVGIPTLRARAGVLSGEAAVTLGATDQGMVAGDLVNTASRVQAAAGPGQVLVGPDTKMVSHGAIEYEAAGRHDLRGKAEPIELWRAVRVIGLTGGAVRSREIEPPFTGRDPELRVLKQLFHGTVDDDRAHLVSVVGSGGIGKSRLAWEFEKYVDGLALDVSWNRGRCLPYGEGVSFWALGEMVRARAGILEDEDSEAALQKLRQLLDRTIPDPAERRFVEPRLAQLLGMDVRVGGGDQENLFSAWRLYFERLSESAPVVLVFDDLHWADAALVDFIAYLLDWARERPIFVLTLARPELLERHPAWGTAKGRLTSLFLEPLGAAQIEALLEGSVAGLPSDLRAQIVERAEGIPFYAVETVRMLVDRGLVVKDGSGYRPTGPIDTLEIPRTLHALISARLDGLAPLERRLLQDASVLGRTFSVAGLAAISGVDEEQLATIFMSLVRKEMLSLQTDPMSPERGQYGFLQDIVRRVAYETLSRHDRRQRHVAAAAYLESLSDGEDDLIEVIASHRLDAYLAVPDGPEAQPLRTAAADTLLRAGDRAASLGSNFAAQRYFERAASLAEEPLHQAELLERAGMSAGAGARTEDALRLYGDAVTLFQSSGADHPAARVSARRAEIMWDQGRLLEGLESMDEAFQLLAEDEPDADLASLAAQIGRFAYFSGNLDLAVERIETALSIAEKLDLPETFSQALNTKALVFHTLGRGREALALLRSALEVALENDKPSAALRAYNNLSDVLLATDSYAEARRVVDDGLLIARRVGNRYWEQILLGTAYPRYALGEWQASVERMAQLGGWDEHIRSRTAFTQGFVAFGVMMHAHRGDLDEAERLLEAFGALAASADAQERTEYACAQAALAAARADWPASLAAALTATDPVYSIGDADYRVRESLVMAIEASLALGKLDDARSLLERLATVPIGRRSSFVAAHGLRLRAALGMAEGNTGSTEADLQQAAMMFDEISFPYWAARTRLELAEWLFTADRPEEATEPLAASREAFAALGAGRWLQRVELAARVPQPTGVAGVAHEVI